MDTNVVQKCCSISMKNIKILFDCRDFFLIFDIIIHVSTAPDHCRIKQKAEYKKGACFLFFLFLTHNLFQVCDCEINKLDLIQIFIFVKEN